ncbi:hypothetical protein ACWKSP_17265 [Micromonosporaceae bacterium Da 78-11]
MAVATPGKQRNRRLRLWLAIAAGVMTLLCLGGVGIAVSLYDDATKIDRASPDQVTSSFLRAYLVNRSDQEAGLFICKSGAQLDAIAALRSEMVDREKKFGTTVTASWESLKVTKSSETESSVAVDLVIIGSSKGAQVSSHSESWDFGLGDSGGWRVCNATKLS